MDSECSISSSYFLQLRKSLPAKWWNIYYWLQDHRRISRKCTSLCSRVVDIATCDPELGPGCVYRTCSFIQIPAANVTEPFRAVLSLGICVSRFHSNMHVCLIPRPWGEVFSCLVINWSNLIIRSRAVNIVMVIIITLFISYHELADSELALTRWIFERFGRTPWMEHQSMFLHRTTDTERS